MSTISIDGVDYDISKADELMRLIQGLLVENTRVSSENVALNNAVQQCQQQIAANPIINTSSQANPIITASSQTKKKVNSPEVYKGDRKLTRNFLHQCNVVFKMQPTVYSDEESKIYFAGSFCRGNANDWFQGKESSGELVGLSWLRFQNLLQKSYGEVDPHEDAIRKMNILKQRSSVAMFTTEFNVLANRTKLNDEGKKEYFRRGLKSEVKDLLITFQKATSFNQYQEQAIEADERLFERRIEEKRERIPVPATNSASAVGSSSSTSAMDLDAVQFTPRKKLTEEEKKARRIAKLCIYDGKSDCGGHPDVNQCINLPKNSNRRAA